MKVTVCELPHEAAALSRAWTALCEHTTRQASELVLLPEFAFLEPLWQLEEFDIARWARAASAFDAWSRRLHELGARYAVGTQPIYRIGRRYNEGFLWSRGQRCAPLRRKFFLPDEAGSWEARWFTRGDRRFPRYLAGPLAFGLNICTEIWALDTYAMYSAMKVHAVLCPRATCSASTATWLAAGVVAAVRSGAYCLSSNRAHPDGSGGGAGWIVSPDGAVLAQTTPHTPFVTLDIDIPTAERAQVTYPRYALAEEPVSPR